MGRDALRTRCVPCGTAAQRRAGPAQQRVCEDGNALEGQAANAQETGGPTVRETVPVSCRESRSLPLYSSARKPRLSGGQPSKRGYAQIEPGSHRSARPRAGGLTLVLTDGDYCPGGAATLVAALSTNSMRSRCGLIMKTIRRPSKAAAGTGRPSGRKRWLRKRVIVASRSSTS